MNRKMKTEVIAIGLLAAMCIAFLGTVPLSAAEVETPRLDEEWIKVILADDVQRLMAGEIDVVVPDSFADWDQIDAAIKAGYHAISNVQTKDCYLIPNCRDYNPVTHESLFPLNDTAFRVALGWLWGHDSKAASPNFGETPKMRVADSIACPAFPAYYNPDVPVYYTNPDFANKTLIEAGFHVDGGALFGPSGQRCPDKITIKSYSEFVDTMLGTQEIADAFNDFFDNYLGVTNVNFEVLGLPMYPNLYPDVWMQKNFQMAITYMTPGPTSPADWSASWLSYVPWNNPAGVNDPQVDSLARTTVNDANETARQEACKQLQAIIAEKCYYYPLIDFIQWSVISKDFDTQWVNSIGSGFDNTLSYLILQWKSASQPKSFRRVSQGYADHNWNPLYESYGFIWGGERQVFDGPLIRAPWDVAKVIPWIAKGYSTTEITTPWGRPGIQITMKFREGVYWQDTGAYNDTNSNGRWDPDETKYDYPVTAEDAVFAINFAKTYYPTNFVQCFASTGPYAVNASDPYTLNIYLNGTNRFWLYNTQHLLLTLPKHIWEKVTDPSKFDPASTKYKDWTGLNPPDWTKTAPFDSAHGGMKALIGAGPLVFDFWDNPTGIGHLVRNPNYWCDWVREDLNIDFTVNIMDITTAAKAFGTKVGDARYSSPSDVNGDESINIMDLAKIAKMFGWKAFP